MNIRSTHGAPSPLDQAAGLRRLFSTRQVHALALLSNPHVPMAGAVIERITMALACLGHHTLVIDAAETAPPPGELSVLDLACAVEACSPHFSYLGARGLPLRYADARGRCSGLLQAASEAAPQADVLLVHASATELTRVFADRQWRPLLLADCHPESVTHAYAGLKLITVRGGLPLFDLIVDATQRPVLGPRIASRLSEGAERFLDCAMARSAVLHLDDPEQAFGDRRLMSMLHAQIEEGTEKPQAREPLPSTTMRSTYGQMSGLMTEPAFPEAGAQVRYH